MSRPPDRERGRTPRGARPVHPLDEGILTRHHAKILNPADAVPASDGSTVMPTVYQPEWLLIPDLFFRDDNFVTVFGKILDQFRLTYEHPQELRDDDLARQAVRLVRQDGMVLDRPIDAWPVLQGLRASAAEAAGGDDGQLMSMAAQVSLRHLYFASTLRGHAMIGAPGMEGHQGAGAGRTSVYLPQSPPRQEPLLPGQRRPVVVVLDTGCGEHDWLSRQSDLGFPNTLPPTAVVDDWTLKGLNIGDDAEFNPDQTMPLLGELDTHAGHGTFIAGIIRQLAPHVQIRTIRLMSGDGVVDEADIDSALDRLVTEINDARTHDDERWRFVDIVSMSFGAYHEQTPPTAGIAGRIEQLQKLGVMVVASAGNDAVEYELYPAAYADVASVRAMARPGVKAIYGNDGGWVREEAPGYAVVSTLPESFVGNSAPDMVHRNGQRAGFAPESFEAGFGTWSGSSFATAIFAGRAAHALWQWRAGVLAAGTQPALPAADKIDPADAGKRAKQAADAARKAPW